MFALEIDFQDGTSQPEMLLVRRPMALIGASDHAHVVIDDMRSLDFQIQIARNIGRKFLCQALGTHGQVDSDNILNGIYDGEATLDLGVVKFRITSLDSDLILREGEAADRGGVRVLRQACAVLSPLFPALVVLGTPPMVISFGIDQPVQIGRSKKCSLRLDSPDISAEHARIGFESGEFWVEDLGSTHGTFIDQQQVSGRVSVQPGTPIMLGREITIYGVTSEAQTQSVMKTDGRELAPSSIEQQYPSLISLSELVRPARFILHAGVSAVIGRDPSSDMWIGAPHVSRKHCVVTATKSGAVNIVDQSSNGLAYDGGMLIKGEPLDLTQRPSVFDFGGGVTVGLCFDTDQERTFIEGRGICSAFRGSAHDRDLESSGSTLRKLKFWVSRNTAKESNLSDGKSRINSFKQFTIATLDRAKLGWKTVGITGKLIFGFCLIMLVLIVFNLVKGLV